MSDKSLVDRNILVEDYNIDFNQYIDKNLDKVKADLEELLKNTSYKICDCTILRPTYWGGNTINLYGVNNFIAKIEYTYGFCANIKKFHSNQYILFDEIAKQNKIYGPTYTKLMKLLTIEHVKECFKDSLIQKIGKILKIKNSNNGNTDNITLEDVITKRIFTDDEYKKLFNYMLSVIKKYEAENKTEKVELSNLDLTKYIGQNTESVLLELTDRLLEKYKIFDCRQIRFLETYSHSVDIYSDKNNKVTKIEYSDDWDRREVTKKGYIRRVNPNYETLKEFFGLNIDSAISDIIDIITKKYGAGDCRKNSDWFGFNTYGLMVYCDSNNIVKLFIYTDDDGFHTIRPIENPCKNKNLCDISLDMYLGKHVNDVFLELTELLDEKYKIINCKNRCITNSKYQVKLYSDKNSIVKVITYIDGDKKLKILKMDKSNYDISSIDLSKYIGEIHSNVITELLDLLDEKYIMNPKDKNTKYGIWINTELKCIDYDTHECINIVSTIEYIDDKNNKIVIAKAQ